VDARDTLALRRSACVACAIAPRVPKRPLLTAQDLVTPLPSDMQRKISIVR
jgi:hypothetical protein